MHEVEDSTSPELNTHVTDTPINSTNNSSLKIGSRGLLYSCTQITNTLIIPQMVPIKKYLHRGSKTLQYLTLNLSSMLVSVSARSYSHHKFC